MLCVVTQQIFMEGLCAGCVLGARDRAGKKADVPSLLKLCSQSELVEKCACLFDQGMSPTVEMWGRKAQR